MSSPFVSHISFDNLTSTFRIYAGSSLYAFCITPELGLEHLYWGEALHDGYDLRYLDCNAKEVAFSVAENFSETVQLEIPNNVSTVVATDKTLSELQAEWHLHKNMPKSTTREDVRFHNARMENLAWRLMTMTQLNRRRPKFINMGGPTFPIKDVLPQKSYRSMKSIVSESDLVSLNSQLFPRAVGSIGKRSLLSEYADHGTGDFRTPSFKVQCEYGSSITPLRYIRHEILNGRLPLPDYFPGIRLEKDEATTLIVTMHNIYLGLEVDIIYVCVHNFNAITRRTTFRNLRNNLKTIHIAHSLTVDEPAITDGYYFTQLGGGWAHEFNEKSHELVHGIHQLGSTRGMSSHEHNPFAAISHGIPNENFGEVHAFSFIYSGNFLLEAELNEMGNLRINLGIHPNAFRWRLTKGSDFFTPEAILVRSNSGFGGLSRTLHRLYNEHLIPKTWADNNPPIVMNTWETLYYNVNHHSVLELAKKASKMGIDLLLLGDGWFGNRLDNTSSLGDWKVSQLKFPYGLKSMVDEINGMGMKFGLWIEPEMISEDSELFREHPDWILNIPFETNVKTRGLVLDMGNPVIRNHVYHTISELLSSANIEYIKWEMSKSVRGYNIDPHPDCSICVAYQDESGHRCMLGVYELMYKLRRDFPYLVIETSASGGGRFDPGMLYFGPQIWGSVNTQVLHRLKNVYGMMLAYPIRSMAIHVTAVHDYNDILELHIRSMLALCGTFGFDINMLKITTIENRIFKKYCAIYKANAKTIRWGDLYRLWSPFEGNIASWMFVSRDKKEALLFVFCNNSNYWCESVPRLYLHGLIDSAYYEICELLPISRSHAHGYDLNVINGDVLMKMGLKQYFSSSTDSVVYSLKQIPTEVAMMHFESCS